MIDLLYKKNRPRVPIPLAIEVSLARYYEKIYLIWPLSNLKIVDFVANNVDKNNMASAIYLINKIIIN